MNKAPIFAIVRTSLLLLIVVLACACGQKQTPPANAAFKKEVKPFVYENGDIIFQTSRSSQSSAIQAATGSEYSHCGMVFDEDGLYVYEAVQPVKMTPLREWTARGKGGKFVVKRLRDTAPLQNARAYKTFCEAAHVFFQKEYDLTFEWSDDKVYCSELVWKTYKNGLGIALCPTRKLRDFNLAAPEVRNSMKARYGTHIPLDETVVSPKDIFESTLLTTVYHN